METKLAAVLVEQAVRSAVPVTDVCANLGISRQTYYKYRGRFQAEGLAGLTPRSRRPATSPAVTGPAATERIIRFRKQLAEEGFDNGSLSIFYRLLIEGGEAPPAPRTIHRVLVRAGLVDPDPTKARRSRRRFEFPATDDCWQIDAFEHELVDGTFVVVFEVIDDHSRYLLMNLAWYHEDTAGAVEALLAAINRYRVIPFLVLTDNGLAFSGKRVEQRVLFERTAITLGVKPITSRPYHPQTNGKNERHHRTCRKWLDRQPAPATLEEFQQQLDTYRDAYNQQRPHQSLGGQTPAQRRAAGARRWPAAADPTWTPQRTATISDVHTNKVGYVVGLPGHHGATIPLGVEHAGKRLTAVDTEGRILIFDQHRLVRELVINPDQRYQSLPPVTTLTRIGRRLREAAGLSPSTAQAPAAGRGPGGAPAGPTGAEDERPGRQPRTGASSSTENNNPHPLSAM